MTDDLVVFRWVPIVVNKNILLSLMNLKVIFDMVNKIYSIMVGRY